MVTPIIGKKYLSNISKKGGDGFYKSTSGINGIGQLAEEFTNLLSNLTLRSDLEDTTLLTWNTVFPTRGLSKNRKHWCPCCFQESLENNKPIYEQLIWCIQPYQNCLIHKIKLENKCPTCTSDMYFLDRKARPGFCSKCGNWLGMNLISNISDELYREQFIAHMLAYNHKKKNLKLERHKISESLNFYLGRNFEGKLSTAAEKLGFPKTTFRCWINGENIPPIDSIIQICRCLNLSITEFLSKEEACYKAEYLDYRKCSKNKRLKKDHLLIQKLLEKVINEKIPMTISGLAKICDCDRRLISRQYPKQCEVIKGIYSEFLISGKRKRTKLMKKKMEEAFSMLIKYDLYPSRRKVESLLNDKYLVKEEKVSKFWKELKEKYYI
ncbi:hypothetical protein BBV17_26555 [Cytobacillus oceanisediminis]|uniref:HTH cro/C1-type domain-containing protein n=1 Tax=Cytobacillus oceanisediminis TaxID=665099 RepID=A0ABX3CL95_9BACI|nr:hypothetical protein BBV17_26555 [Cytobacillus oceanisediminis]